MNFFTYRLFESIETASQYASVNKWEETDEFFRKKFGRGKVTVYKGDNLTITYSYGANSEDSLSSSRYRKHLGRETQTELDAMKMVDKYRGHYNKSQSEE